MCMFMVLGILLACGGGQASHRVLDLGVKDADLVEAEGPSIIEASDLETLDAGHDLSFDAEVPGADLFEVSGDLSEVDSPKPIDSTTDASDPAPVDLEPDRSGDAEMPVADLSEVDFPKPIDSTTDASDPAPSDPALVEPGPDPAQEADVGQEVPCPACAKYGKPVTTGSVSVPGLNELSGLAASRLHDGILYAHNDSGDTARFFAMDLSGASHGEFRLGAGASAKDWEDMAIGPCDSGWCIYIGDIGDNSHVRQPPQGKGYAVYVVPEPKELDPPSPVTVPFVVLPYRYPDTAKNSETLLVHPITGDIYIVIKDPSPYQVYKFPRPHMPGVQVELELVGTISMGYATGGSIHPCGNRLLLRSYGPIYERVLEPGQPFEAIFTAPAVQVPFLPESALTEAVEYLADGLGYVHVAEGAGRPVVVVRCE